LKSQNMIDSLYLIRCLQGLFHQLGSLLFVSIPPEIRCCRKINNRFIRANELQRIALGDQLASGVLDTDTRQVTHPYASTAIIQCTEKLQFVTNRPTLCAFLPI